METGKKEAEKDTENKQFIDGLFQNAAVGVGAVVLSAVIFVGGEFFTTKWKRVVSLIRWIKNRRIIKNRTATASGDVLLQKIMKDESSWVIG